MKGVTGPGGGALAGPGGCPNHQFQGSSAAAVSPATVDVLCFFLGGLYGGYLSNGEFSLNFLRVF